MFNSRASGLGESITDLFKNNVLFFFTLAFLFPGIIFQPISLEAAEGVGRFALVEGQVNVLRGGVLPAKTVKINDPVYVKDIVRTKSLSRAEIVFIDRNVLKLSQRTRVDISEYFADSAKARGKIKLIRGMVEARVDKEVTRRISLSPEANQFEIHTHNAVAGVRGSQYTVFKQGNLTGIFAKEGVIQVFNPQFPNIIITLMPGQFTIVTQNNPPLPAQQASEGMKQNIERNMLPLEKNLEGGPGPGGLGDAPSEVPQIVIFTGGEDGNSPAAEYNKTTYAVSGTSTIIDVYTPQPVTDYKPEIVEKSSSKPESPPQSSQSTPLWSPPPPSPQPSPPPPPPPPPSPPPPVEVGRISLSGSIVAGSAGTVNFMSVMMNNVVFMAPSTGQRPTTWNTGAISGQYTFGTGLNRDNITNSPIRLSSGRGVSADFQFRYWNGTSWNAVVNNGAGTLTGSSYNGPVNFSGSASGTIGNGNISGTGSGTAR